MLWVNSINSPNYGCWLRREAPTFEEVLSIDHCLVARPTGQPLRNLKSTIQKTYCMKWNSDCILRKAQQKGLFFKKRFTFLAKRFGFGILLKHGSAIFRTNTFRKETQKLYFLKHGYVTPTVWIPVWRLFHCVSKEFSRTPHSGRLLIFCLPAKEWVDVSSKNLKTRTTSSIQGTPWQDKPRANFFWNPMYKCPEIRHEIP